ncbi:hypothetical protein FA13DRAFT_1714810 [Coprinellus micaceus]|uniref:Uncharacterized protein n=1 Tax=Coprinellus micaceus TaxID=71717 RepID=A0A4Y7SRD0_COPMI|nr:hypothetical protein FA13DRAFT_1714810 [Coprinellus micaceus]
MGRPRLYSTPEEQQAAKQRNAKRWYDNNKEKYNKKQEGEHVSQGVIPREGNVVPPGPRQSQPRVPTEEGQQPENVHFCTAEVKSMPTQFQQLLGGRPVTVFLIEVTTECIGCLKECNGNTSRATNFVHECVDKYGGWLLNLVGMHNNVHRQSQATSYNLCQMGNNRGTLRQLQEGTLRFPEMYPFTIFDVVS